MKIIAIVALCIACTFAAPNGYGTPEIRLTSYDTPIVKSSYVAPVLKSTYEAPVLKSSYVAPVLKSGYEAPIVRSSYEAPVVKVVDTYGGYSTPVVRSHVPIIRYLKNDDNYGTYNFEVETGDGALRHESGSLRNLNTPESEGPVVVQQGSYSFTSPEGQLFTVRYTADENGFHAEGDHLPTSPPVPEEILKSLSLPRVHDSYDSTYSAPTLVRSSGYSAPALIRSSGY